MPKIFCKLNHKTSEKEATWVALTQESEGDIREDTDDKESCVSWVTLFPDPKRKHSKRDATALKCLGEVTPKMEEILNSQNIPYKAFTGHYDYSGVFKHEPTSSFSTISGWWQEWWTLSAGIEMNLSFDLPSDVIANKEVYALFKWAGWRQDSEVSIYINNNLIAYDHGVSGTLSNPIIENFRLPKKDLKTKNNVLKVVLGRGEKQMPVLVTNFMILASR